MGSVFVVNMRFALYLLHLIFLRIYTYIIKKVYGATSLKAAEAEFERFKQAWSQYPGALDVWVRNWKHVAQLYNYGSAVRKVLYIINAVESFLLLKWCQLMFWMSRLPANLFFAFLSGVWDDFRFAKRCLACGNAAVGSVQIQNTVQPQHFFF